GKGPVDALAFSADGTLLTSAGPAGVQVWDGKTGKLQFDFAGHRAPVHAVAAHPRFPLFATANGRAQRESSGLVRVWDGRSGQVLATYSAASPCQAVAFAPGEPQLLAVGCGDGTIHLWRPTSRLLPLEVQAAALAGQ